MSKLAPALTLLFLQSANAADLPADYRSQTAEQPAAQAPAAMRTFAACRRAIAEWAEPFAPVDIETVSIGPVQRQFNGTKVAPLFVRIVYDTGAGRETRKANVKCTIDASDTVEVHPTE